jgi:fructose-specific component phosphotransferase system IIB-like protein
MNPNDAINNQQDEPPVDDNVLDFDTPVDYEQEEPKQEEPPVKQEELKQEEPPASADPDAIAKAVQEGIAKATASQQQQEEEPELTQEQIDEYLKRAKVTPEQLKTLGLIDDDLEADVADQRVKAMQDLVGAAVQEAIATAQVMLQHNQQELTQQFNPVIEAYKAQQQQQIVQHFYSTYPDLQSYEEIVRLATAELKQTEKLTGNDLETDMKLVAAKSAEMIEKFGGKKVNISATHKSPSQPAQQQQAQQSTVPKPAASTTGGRSQQPGSQAASQGSDDLDFLTE